MAFTYVTITRDYDLADGIDPTGEVSFTPTAPMTNGPTVVAAPVSRTLDIDGILSIPLAANTDPATTPVGSSYLVKELIAGVSRSYYVQIPHNAGTTIDLSTLVTAPIPPVVTYPVAGPAGPAAGDSFVAVKSGDQGFFESDPSADIAGLVILANSENAQEVWTVTLTLDLRAVQANDGPFVASLWLDDVAVPQQMVVTMPTDGTRETVTRVWKLGPLTGADHTFRLTAAVSGTNSGYTVGSGHSCLFVDRTPAEPRGASAAVTRTVSNPLTGVIKGSNIHPSSADFSGPNSVWSNLWNTWDWTGSIQPGVDKTVAAGGNCVRLIGGLTAVLEDGLSQSTYAARHIQLATYCQSLGIRYYMCGGDTRELTSTTLQEVSDHLVWLGTTMQPYANVILGYDLNNEFIASTNYDHDDLIDAMSGAMTQMRAAGVTIPLTGSATPPRPGLHRLADASDFMDFHIYAEIPPDYLDWLGPISADRPILIGEFGGTRATESSAQMTARYSTMRAMVSANSDVAGVVQWAIQDNDTGIYNDAGLLQTDISGEWALFPGAPAPAGQYREVLSKSVVGAVTMNTGLITQVGDQLVCIRMTDAFTDSTTLTAPTGTAGTWTQQGTDIASTDQAPRVRVWTRTVTVAGSQTVTCATTTKANHVVLYVLPAGRTVNAVATSYGANGAAATTRVAPSVTATGSNPLLICCGAEYDAPDFTGFGTLTADAEIASNASSAWAGHQQVTAGATGTRTVTKATGSEFWVTASIAAAVT